MRILAPRNDPALCRAPSLPVWVITRARKERACEYQAARVATAIDLAH